MSDREAKIRRMEEAAKEIAIKKLGMIGVGSMDSMMSLLYAEHGCEVHFYDPSDEHVRELEREAKKILVDRKIVHQKDYKELCESLRDGDEGPICFVFSHVIIDCSNELRENTERRQAKLDPKGIHYVGCGVSGGYQSARHGPSCSPGGSKEGLEAMMPFLRQIAAKDNQGKPCTVPVGLGGSGHYVKMVHKWYRTGDDVGDGRGLAWNKSGPLRDCFLVDIGANICRTKNDLGEYVLVHVRDKVVQDVDESEGTGYWTCEQAVAKHVPAASILAAHLFRCASADAERRISVKKSFGGGVSPQPIKVDTKEAFVKELQMSVYSCFLMCFAQGLHTIKKTDQEKGWKIHYGELLQLWRGGCIIQADFIVDLLQKMYNRNDHDDDDILSNHEIGSELSKHFPALKNVVLKSIEADMYVPSTSQSLEFYNSSGSTELPTQFMEAELDYFGAHNFDLKEGPPGRPQTGSEHFEWLPAKGIFDKKP